MGRIRQRLLPNILKIIDEEHGAGSDVCLWTCIDCFSKGFPEETLYCIHRSGHLVCGQIIWTTKYRFGPFFARRGLTSHRFKDVLITTGGSLLDRLGLSENILEEKVIDTPYSMTDSGGPWIFIKIGPAEALFTEGDIFRNRAVADFQKEFMEAVRRAM